MKIAICGQSLPPFNNEVLKKSYQIGREISINKHILRFGGCWGYPYEAAKGGFENKGEVIAISPGKNKKEHIGKYKFPSQNISKFEFTGLGIPGRNIPLVVNSDAIIIISGQSGTLNEFTIAFYKRKPIGVLKGSGGITHMIREIVEICDKNGEKENIVYEKDPKRLIGKLINLIN